MVNVLLSKNYLAVSCTCNFLKRASVARNYLSLKNSSSSSKSREGEEQPFNPERPIRFSTSPAGNYNIKHIRFQHDPIQDAPWPKQVIMWGTLFCSIIYLFFFRPRNDIDDELEMPLGKRLLWIREEQILKEKNAALRNGISTKEFDEKLKEIQRLRKKYNYDDD